MQDTQLLLFPFLAHSIAICFTEQRHKENSIYQKVVTACAYISVLMQTK